MKMKAVQCSAPTPPHRITEFLSFAFSSQVPTHPTFLFFLSFFTFPLLSLNLLLITVLLTISPNPPVLARSLPAQVSSYSPARPVILFVRVLEKACAWSVCTPAAGPVLSRRRVIAAAAAAGQLALHTLVSESAHPCRLLLVSAASLGTRAES